MAESHARAGEGDPFEDDFADIADAAGDPANAGIDETSASGAAAAVARSGNGGAGGAGGQAGDGADFDFDTVGSTLGASQTGGDDQDNINQDIGQLRRALWNEKAAPEILPYEHDAVEDLRQLIDFQQQQIDKVGATVFENFQANLYQQELNRVKFLLKSYLRTRLFKITQYAAHISADPEQMNRLSHAELTQVLEPYSKLLNAHLRQSFVDSLPDRFQKLDANDGDLKMRHEPDLDKYVFCHVDEDVGSVDVGHDELVNFQRGNIIAVRYRPIQQLIEEGRVHLV